MHLRAHLQTMPSPSCIVQLQLHVIMRSGGCCLFVLVSQGRELPLVELTRLTAPYVLLGILLEGHSADPSALKIRHGDICGLSIALCASLSLSPSDLLSFGAEDA